MLFLHNVLNSLQFKPNKELLECQFSEKLIGEALSIFEKFTRK